METSLALLPGDEVFLSVMAVTFIVLAVTEGNLLAPLLIILGGPVYLLVAAAVALGVCSECGCLNWLIGGYTLVGVVLMIEGYSGIGTTGLVGGLVSLFISQLCDVNMIKTFAWETTFQDLVLAAGGSVEVTNVLKNAFALRSAEGISS